MSLLTLIEWLGGLGLFSVGALCGAWIVESDHKRTARAEAEGPLL